MAELTKEQIEVAFKAFSDCKGTCRDSLKAAAPYLQTPWDEPTPAEILHLNNDEMSQILKFVLRRNAALLPKPVDPRREAIVNILSKYPDRAPEIADQILAAIDEAKVMMIPQK